MPVCPSGHYRKCCPVGVSEANLGPLSLRGGCSVRLIQWGVGPAEASVPVWTGTYEVTLVRKPLGLGFYC